MGTRLETSPISLVFQYGVKEGVIVKGREFLVGRMHRRLADQHQIVVAARSFEIADIPVSKGKIRYPIEILATLIQGDPAFGRRTLQTESERLEFDDRRPSALSGLQRQLADESGRRGGGDDDVARGGVREEAHRGVEEDRRVERVIGGRGFSL